jgi:hypothetical protein
MEHIPITSALTFEQAMLILDKQHQDTLAKIEADKKLHAEEMRKRDEELKLQMEKKDEEMRKRDEELKEFKAQMKKRDAKFKKLSIRFGDLGNRLGEIVEYLVTSNLKEKFDRYGFYFRTTALRVKITDNNRKDVTDIDVLLYDGDKVMAVEVKTRPTLVDVDRHILRMEQIQLYTPGLVEHKKVYGGIAGAIIDADVREAVFSAGFYLITQTDDNVDVIDPPSDFVAKYWTTTTRL